MAAPPPPQASTSTTVPTTSPTTTSTPPSRTSILPLLKRLWPDPGAASVTADEIASAVALIFTDALSPVQAGALLTCLHFTGWDRRADVLAQCSRVMCGAAAKVDRRAVRDVILRKEANGEGGLRLGRYEGGLCDIVGTGGDAHNTFNVSTAASIVAGGLVRIGKHGNKASTSNSGSADLLRCARLGDETAGGPVLEAVRADTLAEVYSAGNYAFLFAPMFHSGMRHIAAVRKELGWRTIFNLLGPLANPLEDVAAGIDDGTQKGEPPLLEARIIGVARRDIGEIFADALRKNGARKAMVVCGDEDMDELSPAGPTHCWMLKDSASKDAAVEIKYFTLHPSDFGLRTSTLAEVSPGKTPEDNAAILRRLLYGELPAHDPVLNFVLLNAAALLVVTGVCDAEGPDVITERGPGGGRWKEGVRRARWSIESGQARKMFGNFVEVTRRIDERGRANPP